MVNGEWSIVNKKTYVIYETPFAFDIQIHHSPLAIHKYDYNRQAIRRSDPFLQRSFFKKGNRLWDGMESAAYYFDR